MGFHCGGLDRQFQFFMSGEAFAQAQSILNFSKVGQIAISPQVYSLVRTSCTGHMQLRAATASHAPSVEWCILSSLKPSALEHLDRIASRRPLRSDLIAQRLARAICGAGRSETREEISHRVARETLSIEASTSVASSQGIANQVVALVAKYSIQPIQEIDSHIESVQHALMSYIPSLFSGLDTMQLQSASSSGSACAELQHSKKVTVVFISLVNVDWLSAKSLNILQRAFLVAQIRVAEEGGHVKEASIDDKGCVFVAVFSHAASSLSAAAAVTSDGQACSAVRCALRLQADLQSFDADCAVGIATGPAILGVFGTMERREHAVLSSAMNRAARLMCVALPATYASGLTHTAVLMDAATHASCRHSARSFGIQEWPRMLVKGSEREISVYQAMRLDRDMISDDDSLSDLCSARANSSASNLPSMGSSVSPTLHPEVAQSVNGVDTNVLQQHGRHSSTSAPNLVVAALPASKQPIASMSSTFVAVEPGASPCQQSHISAGELGIAASTGPALASMSPVDPNFSELKSLCGTLHRRSCNGCEMHELHPRVGPFVPTSTSRYRVVDQRLFQFQPPVNVVSASCHQTCLKPLTRGQAVSPSGSRKVAQGSAFDELATFCVSGKRAFIGQDKLTVSGASTAFAAFPNLCRASKIAQERTGNRFDRALLLHLRFRRVWGIRVALLKSSQTIRGLGLRQCEWAQLSHQMATIEADHRAAAAGPILQPAAAVRFERLPQSNTQCVVDLVQSSDGASSAAIRSAPGSCTSLPKLKPSLFAIASRQTTDRVDSADAQTSIAFPAIQVWPVPIVKPADAAATASLSGSSAMLRRAQKTGRHLHASAHEIESVARHHQGDPHGSNSLQVGRHHRSQSDCGGI